ncbi:protein trapped in endoderm-1-like [Procambarus clarkii]|uniref:protein trapped in endoderm-1-like n=1 Tax=Procambarus clarkii TaxID=6728 RepID=UPI0037445645
MEETTIELATPISTWLPGNTGSVPRSQYSSEVVVLTSICNFFTCFIGTFGNVMVMVVMLSSKKLRSNHNTAFMVNLALCLIPICCYTLPLMVAKFFEGAEYGDGLTEKTMWIVYNCLVILHQVHILSICIVAVNRVVALRSPVVFRRMLRSSVVALQLVLIWVLSVIFWLPLSFIEIRFAAYTVTFDITNKILRKFHILITYFIPLIATIICYVFIYVKLRQRRTGMSELQTREGNMASASGEGTLSASEAATAETVGSCRRWEEEASRSVFIISIILVVCSLPHAIIHFVCDCVNSVYCDQQFYGCLDAWLLIHTLQWLQFCLDPIVFVVVSAEYRKAVLQCLRRLSRTLTFRSDQMRHQ